MMARLNAPRSFKGQNGTKGTVISLTLFINMFLREVWVNLPGSQEGISL
jgi:hypothetical protein